LSINFLGDWRGKLPPYTSSTDLFSVEILQSFPVTVHRLKIFLLLHQLTLLKTDLINIGLHRNLNNNDWQAEITATGSRSKVS